jgi:hypothetical protein
MSVEKIKGMRPTPLQQEFEEYGDIYSAETIRERFLKHYPLTNIGCKGLGHIIGFGVAYNPRSHEDLMFLIPDNPPQEDEIYNIIIKERGHPQDPSLYPAIIFEPFENGYLCTEILCFKPKPSSI